MTEPITPGTETLSHPARHGASGPRSARGPGTIRPAQVPAFARRPGAAGVPTDSEVRTAERTWP